MTHLWDWICSGVSYAIPFILVLSAVVFVHEFGHYWVARRCGVKVVTFSIGFGGEIFGWNDKNGTRWKVSWLPLGGYVKMYGDADPSSARPGEETEHFTEEDKKVAFFSQSLPKRFAVVAAGPLFNYAFAILTLMVLFSISGQPTTPPVVDTLLPASAAEKAGLAINDRVLSIDGQKVERFEEIKRIVALNMGAVLDIEVSRDGQVLHIPVTPDVVEMTDRLGTPHRTARLGISSQAVEFKKQSPVEALGSAFIETWSLTASTLKAVGQMIMGVRGTDELGGPIRIAQMSGKVATEGTSSIIWFLAVISINLGLINLFPIPLLDGGTLMFYSFEALCRRPLSETVQEVGLRIGFVVVMSLMVFATWNDLVQLRVVSYLRDLFS